MVILCDEEIVIGFYCFLQTCGRIQIDSFSDAYFKRVFDMASEIAENAIWCDYE